MTARVAPPKPVPVWDLPPGHFTTPCRAWFGEHWRPYGEWGRNSVAIYNAAARGRETQLAAGYSGSLPGLSKRADARLAAVSAPAPLAKTRR